jgi:hypothetical protein
MGKRQYCEQSSTKYDVGSNKVARLHEAFAGRIVESEMRSNADELEYDDEITCNGYDSDDGSTIQPATDLLIDSQQESQFVHVKDQSTRTTFDSDTLHQLLEMEAHPPPDNELSSHNSDSEETLIPPPISPPVPQIVSQHLTRP